MMEFHPIETRYNGYRFRSRTEARWAVFFDAMPIEYDYESQGFDIEGVAYLPDFYLPSLRSYFEIKGGVPTAQELDKAERLCCATGRAVYIAVGDPFSTKDYYHIMPMPWCDPRDEIPSPRWNTPRTLAEAQEKGMWIPNIAYLDERGITCSTKEGGSIPWATVLGLDFDAFDMCRRNNESHSTLCATCAWGPFESGLRKQSPAEKQWLLRARIIARQFRFEKEYSYRPVDIYQLRDNFKAVSS